MSDDSRVLALHLAKWIAGHPSTTPDHACEQCVPGGDIVIPGFVCGQHVALALLKAAAGPCRECNDTGNTEGIPLPGRWVDCPKCGDPKWRESQ